MWCLRWIIPFSVLLVIASVIGETDSASVQQTVAAPEPNKVFNESFHALPKPGDRSHQWNAPTPGKPNVINRVPEQVSDQVRYTPVNSFETALVSTTEFWSKRIDGYYQPRMVIYTGNRIQTRCTLNIDPIEHFAFYCPIDQTIFFNQAFINEMPSAEGLYQVLAHEVGHHVQLLLGLLDHGLKDDAIRALEDEADCFSGAWVGWVIQQNNAPGSNWINEINLKWDHYHWRELQFSGQFRETHSKPLARKQLFLNGISGGISVCSSTF